MWYFFGVEFQLKWLITNAIFHWDRHVYTLFRLKLRYIALKLLRQKNILVSHLRALLLCIDNLNINSSCRLYWTQNDQDIIIIWRMNFNKFLLSTSVTKPRPLRENGTTSSVNWLKITLSNTRALNHLVVNWFKMTFSIKLTLNVSIDNK